MIGEVDPNVYPKEYAYKELLSCLMIFDSYLRHPLHIG
jgi:hypothetical protein